MLRYTLLVLVGLYGATSILHGDPPAGSLPASLNGQSDTSATQDQDAKPDGPEMLLVDITHQQDQVIDSLVDVTARTIESTTMFGVHVRQPNSTLRSHLRMGEGMGLVIEYVVADSAAADAGLEVNDVMLALDDQELVNEEQLTTLVRNREPGEIVILSFMRRGEKQSAKVELKEGRLDVTESVDTEHSRWLLEVHPRFQMDGAFSHKKVRHIDCKSCHVGPSNLPSNQ